MRASPSRVAARHMASQDVVAVGDLAVFPPINDNYKYWRGSPEPVLEYGEKKGWVKLHKTTKGHRIEAL